MLERMGSVMMMAKTTEANRGKDGPGRVGAYVAVDMARMAGGRYAVLMSWLLLALFLLLLPAPSSAAMPTVETLPPISAHLKLPSGVAVGDDETIYVVESNLNQMHLFDRSGRYQRSLYGLDDPVAVAVDGAGRIYIANVGKGNVEVYAPDLSRLGALGQGDGEFQKPVGIAVDSAGRIYVVDGRENRVKIYHADRSFKSAFGGRGTGNGQFQTPTAIVVNEVTGEILVPDLVALSTSARVQVFDLDGVFLRSFITTGTNEQGETVAFIRPYGIAVDTLDRIYVTDGYQNVVTVYNTYGDYLGKLYDRDRLLRNPLGIAFAPGSSRLFVASLNSGTVETYGIDNVYGNIAASPPAHDFGTLTVGDAPVSQRFAFTNDGSGALAVGAVALAGADASEFAVTADDCADRTLPPAAGCMVEVAFQPLAAGDKSASLQVHSDDLYQPELALALSGRADPRRHRLTVSTDGPGSGTVHASGINCGAVCSAEYPEGSTVALSALPHGDAIFRGWSGGGCSGTAACTVTMTRATAVTATFDLQVSTFTDRYTVTVSAGANGTITPGTATYRAGDAPDFTIAADAGYRISDVRVDGLSVGAVESYRFDNIDRNHEISAEFTIAGDTLLLTSIAMGEVSVGEQWKRVEFGKTFTDPVVVAKPASRNDPSPAVVRVRNVDAQGFEVRIQEWEYLDALLDDDPAHAEEQVAYLAIERGSYKLEDGTRIEAGWFDTDATSGFETIRFAQSFTVPPVVMSSIVTYNEEEMAVVGRIGRIDTTGFGHMLQEQGLNDPAHAVERAAYIAWEPSQGVQNGIHFEAGTIDGVPTQQSSAVGFSGSYQSAPLLIADLQTTNDGTIGAVNPRWSDKSTTGVSLLLDQEISSSVFAASLSGKEPVPPSPSVEDVGYLVLWSAEMLPQTLTVVKTGQGSGRVESGAQGIDCGTTCSGSYSHGAEVTLTATAESGSRFAGWSGGGCSGTENCVITLDRAVTVTAQFEPATYTVTATAGPNGRIAPLGETVAKAGATLAYEITADAGYRIVDVTVDGVSRGARERYEFVDLDRDHEISATFAARTYLLTVDKTGQGSGRVETATRDIDCGPDCSSHYGSGTEVTLTATAESGSRFAGWSGDCSGTAPTCRITLDRAAAVTAQFDRMPAVTYTITATAGPNGSITPQGETVVSAGATQDYTIVADAGYHIASVLVDGEEQGIVDSFRFADVDADHTISVHFASSVFKLTDIAMGEVSVGHSWKPVTWGRFFADPVVVAKPASRNAVDPAVVRIRNVTTRGFELKIQEWDYLDGEHADEQVSYIVMERGNHVLKDGTRIEAGRFEADNTEAFEKILFARPKAAPPVILSSVVSYNEEDAVVGRIKDVDEEGFQYRLQEQGDAVTAGHAAETVSFIAWEASIGRQDGMSFEVSCLDNAEVQQFHSIGFISSYAPSLQFVADLQTAEHGKAVNLRWRNRDEEGIELLIDQERSQPEEPVLPSVEEIGYLVLSEQTANACTGGLESDCDGDGLSDEDEINIYGTDPYLANTDGDHWEDGKEVLYWMGRWNEDDDGDGVINLLDFDSNGDGEADGSAFAGNKSVKARGCGRATVVASEEREGADGDSRTFEGRQGFVAPGSAFEKRRGFATPGRSFEARSGFTTPPDGFEQDAAGREFTRALRAPERSRGFVTPKPAFKEPPGFSAPAKDFEPRADFD